MTSKTASPRYCHERLRTVALSFKSDLPHPWLRCWSNIPGLRANLKSDFDGLEYDLAQTWKLFPQYSIRNSDNMQISEFEFHITKSTLAIFEHSHTVLTPSYKVFVPIKFRFTLQLPENASEGHEFPQIIFNLALISSLSLPSGSHCQWCSPLIFTKFHVFRFETRD